jgi:hypothetical protein
MMATAAVRRLWKGLRYKLYKKLKIEDPLLADITRQHAPALDKIFPPSPSLTLYSV